MKEILDVCLEITGSFENGSPSYTSITGNFDGQGLSVGVLQWCAGQGSLRVLLERIASYGEDIDSHFSIPVSSLLTETNNARAVQWVVANFLDGKGKPTKEACSQWASLLGSDNGVRAQVDLAMETVLGKAMRYAAQYYPQDPNNLRVIAFFFDIVTQSGSMGNSRGRVNPVPNPDGREAYQYAKSHPKFSRLIEQSKADPLTNILLFYALERAKLSKAEYMWDAFSRRATIAARHGIVHGKVFDLTGMLP